MSRALLIAPHASYRIAAYMAAADRLGVAITLASTARASLAPAAHPGLHVVLDDPDATLASIKSAHGRTPFAAVLATDDATVAVASRVAAALGLPHNPPQAAQISRRKDLARHAQARAGICVPAFRRLDPRKVTPAACGDLRFPCVLKPLAWSGSRGVIRADSPDELTAACGRLAAMLDRDPPDDPDERRYALVEDFLPGAEVALEGILSGGQLEPLAVFDKPDPLNGPFFEETYYITPSRHPEAVLRSAFATVARVCAAYGLREGPVHAELRLGPTAVWPLEVAARTIGGDCARLLKFGSGHGLEELVLARALGMPLDGRRQAQAAGVLMIPTTKGGVLRRVEGILAAQRVPGVEEVALSVRAGHEVTPLPEGASYLGFVFARGPDPAFVEQALRSAHAHLNVVVAPRWRIEVA